MKISKEYLFFVIITLFIVYYSVKAFYKKKETFRTKIFPQSEANELTNKFLTIRAYILNKEISPRERDIIRNDVNIMRNMIQRGIDNDSLQSIYRTIVIEYLLSNTTIEKIMSKDTPFIIKKGILKKIEKWINFIKNNTELTFGIHYLKKNPTSIENEEIKVKLPDSKIELFSAGSNNASSESEFIKDFDIGKDNGGYNLFRVKKPDEDKSLLKTYKIRESCLRRIPGTPVRYGQVTNALDIVNEDRDVRYKASQYFSKPRLIMAETTHGKNSLNNYAAKYYLDYVGKSPEGLALYHILVFNIQERRFSDCIMVNYDGSISVTKRNPSIENTLFVLEDYNSSKFNFIEAESGNVSNMALRSYGYKGLTHQNHYFYQYYNDMGGNIEEVIESSTDKNAFIFKYIPVQY
jgi:hypothetical protein